MAGECRASLMAKSLSLIRDYNQFDFHNQFHREKRINADNSEEQSERIRGHY
jgi:hypothetical protein